MFLLVFLQLEIMVKTRMWYLNPLPAFDIHTEQVPAVSYNQAPALMAGTGENSDPGRLTS